MKNYIVYFELFGKKMKSKVLADSKEDAQERIKSKIIFHRTDLDDKDEYNDIMKLFDIINDALDKMPKKEGGDGTAKEK